MRLNTKTNTKYKIVKSTSLLPKETELQLRGIALHEDCVFLTDSKKRERFFAWKRHMS